MGNDLSGKAVAPEVDMRGYGHENPISIQFQPGGSKGRVKSQRKSTLCPHLHPGGAYPTTLIK
jgi:hypothetical protein